MNGRWQFAVPKQNVTFGMVFKTFTLPSLLPIAIAHSQRDTKTQFTEEEIRGMSAAFFMKHRVELAPSCFENHAKSHVSFRYGKLSSAIHDNITNMTVLRSSDLLTRFWFLTHHFAAKNPKKKTGWLRTLKNGEKRKMHQGCISPRSGKWLWKIISSFSLIRGGGGR